jgi:4'-phosphopantetheinyl transferase
MLPRPGGLGEAIVCWAQPPVPLRLEKGEVHLWRARLDLPAAAVEALALTLSPDEQERAARFRVPQVRARFTAARAILRDILGGYLGCHPSAVLFGYREHGKPFLAAGHEEDLRFNLSHSHGLALYGVCRGREIGIDLERIRHDREHDRLARRFFSPAEAAALQGLPPEQRVEAFFQCWTRKEAYLKARGEGLAAPLASFEVTLAPGEPAALRNVAGDPREAGRWWLAAIQPGSGYAGALAVEGPPLAVRTWEWRWISSGSPPGLPGF